MPDPRLTRFLDALVTHALEHDDFADALRGAAEAIIDRLDAPSTPEASATIEEVPDDVPSPDTAREGAAVAADGPQLTPPAEPASVAMIGSDDLARLRAWAAGGPGGDGVQEDSFDPPRPWKATTDAVLAPLAGRFAAKADAARWRADGDLPDQRHKVLSKLLEAEADRSILDVPVVDGTPENWTRLANTYGAAAMAADALSAFVDAGRLLSPGTPFAEAVAVAAEAQSAVRAAYWNLRGLRAGVVPPKAEHDDPDQVDLFWWLREATDLDGVYVERHMKWEDPADPARACDVEEHLRQIARSAGVSLRSPRPGATAQVLKAAAYHADRLARGDWDADHQRSRLLECLDAAVTAGVPPSDLRFRDILAPVADCLPPSDDPAVPARSGRVLAELYDHLFQEPDQHDPDERPSPPEHIVEAARLLRGKHLALFGGVPRQAAISALESELELASVEWVETRAHQSTASFDPVVARADVAIQLIRFSSHSFADLREMCAAHGAAFVRAPRGYSPSAIASAILEQASGVLEHMA